MIGVCDQKMSGEWQARLEDKRCFIHKFQNNFGVFQFGFGESSHQSTLVELSNFSLHHEEPVCLLIKCGARIREQFEQRLFQG